ncbi:DUF1616 domain-containing protein [Haloterrigena alkaliphila]|uniref:DUF1616 domain-containing protein n=1 Tax=Haloterrigena alkaliphila TaxID=2816475 RepID=A0A8A2VD26_9EURY|nr:DUF1616 domain-containing protein [Haloterrigena alkaliphila]QSW99411.1 DUF1616 domain-containing protein [Haloterrigena alkaliphila]
MADRRATQDSPARNDGWLPTDLAAVLVATGLAVVVAFAPVLRGTPLHVPVAIAFVLFVPGYALVAALFPERDRSVDQGGDESGRERWLGTGGGIDGIDRFALSIVLSAILVPTVGLAMNYTPWGIRPGPVVAAVSVVTVLLTVVAARRRAAVAPSARFATPVRPWAARVRRSLLPNETRGDVLLNGLLVVAVGVAVASVGFAVAGPGLDGTSTAGDDGFSAIYLLDDSGDLLANESATLEAGNNSTVTVGIENGEHRTVSYTVVAVEQELATDDSGDLAVETQRELARFETELEHGESDEIEQTIDPATDESSNETARIVWLLYPGDVPEEPSPANAEAYATLSLEESDEGNGDEAGGNDGGEDTDGRDDGSENGNGSD